MCLHKFDSVQKLLCGTTFSSLATHRNASPISLLCKLQDLLCWDSLQSFYPALTSVQYPYSFHHVEDDNLLLWKLVRYNSGFIY